MSLFRIISNHKTRKLLSQEIKSDIEKHKQTKYELYEHRVCRLSQILIHTYFQLFSNIIYRSCDIVLEFGFVLNLKREKSKIELLYTKAFRKRLRKIHFKKFVLIKTYQVTGLQRHNNA